MVRTAPGPTGKVLIVDDEPEIVAFIRELLMSRRHTVVGISDSREAAAEFDSFQPDVCILDFRMPHFTGSVLLDAFKQKDAAVEVIFLTAQDETSLAGDLMKRGAIDFLLKPVEINQLELSVSPAPRNPRLMDENENNRTAAAQLV